VSQGNIEREARLFAEACELSPDERVGFLDRECGDDAGLRARVGALLSADGTTGAGLDQPAVEGLRDELAAQDHTPEQIGPFRIVGVLGRGGMGVVYEAEQEHPERRVALKVVRPGFVSESLLRRFEHEARVLGWLNHPGIAQIYEAGTADTGAGPQPFFAMELIRGVPLTRYADENGLGTAARLDLLAKVCDAVQHAHQKGVIHRDLKPGNVLVDSDGQPKVVDFGVARVTDSDLQATTLHTEAGELVGTLTYMSPEQVSGQPGAVDTRSDVYALGVLAHELLAGQPPLDLRGKMVHEAARAILEDEPSTLGVLDGGLRGDVETIVAKSLEKDKERRYPSAEELASDIRRFLSDEPIVARPASTLYQLGKFARRNKALVSGVAVALIALLSGTFTSTWLYFDAERARVDARAEALAATQVRDFLVELFMGASPLGNHGEPTTLRDVLDRGAERIHAELDYEPRVQAELMSTMALTYTILFMPDRAEPLLERAAEIARTLDAPEDQETRVRTLRRLGRLRIEQERFEQALVELREAHAAALEVYGADHGSELWARSNVGLALWKCERLDEAHEILSSVSEQLDTREFGDDEGGQDVHDFERAHRTHYAGVLDAIGDTDGAMAEMRKLIARLEEWGWGDDPQAAVVKANLAWLLHDRDIGDEEAERLFAEALEITERNWGVDAFGTWQPHTGLGRMAYARGDLETAERHLTAAWKAHVASGRLGAITADITCENLVDVRSERGDYTGALSPLLEVLEYLEGAELDATEQLRRKTMARVRAVLTGAAAAASAGDGPPPWESMLETVLPWLEERGRAEEAMALLDATLDAVVD
jgi:serine/threonine protein kinase